ncbi:MAG: hypothetical protein Tsb002_34040 [Wenzhouxiangellaceae bacterium]
MTPQQHHLSISQRLMPGMLSLLCLMLSSWPALAAELRSAITYEGATNRNIDVELVVLEQLVPNNRLGAQLTNAQIYALKRDVVPGDHPYDKHGNDSDAEFDADRLQPGNVRLRSYKRPRPLVLRANVGDHVTVRMHNLLPPPSQAVDCNGAPPSGTPNGPYFLSCAGFQVMGLNWDSSDNQQRIAPGESHTYTFIAEAEGVFMIYSPNGTNIPFSQNDFYLFGAFNVQPEEAEWYRSQVTRDDLKLASYRVNRDFMRRYWSSDNSRTCRKDLTPDETGLPANHTLRRKEVYRGNRLVCPKGGADTIWLMSLPTLPSEATSLTSEVRIDEQGRMQTLNGQPVLNYQAMYPARHPRAGSPVLNMLTHNPDSGRYQMAHSDLTAIITGPQAGRFPYYLDSPSFRENPATPDRRQPYREFTIHYHISPNTSQAFEAFSSGPLASTYAAGQDDFAVNYGIAGIGPEIYANRINVGPMGINKDEVDLLFEEFFLSSWAVGDPALLTDITANNPDGKRATKALYPDDPSNVYHSYMRDHVKFRVLNAGSVAPHVHHQHAHQWLHSPNSADGHYLDSQMIAPGSTYTMEMTYNGSGNRNQTVGDSIFHCHIYPHFAQGMWGLWRVHDVFESGTQLDRDGRPVKDARALPDGELVMGSPIPALVPLPTLGMAPLPGPAYLVDNGRRAEVPPVGEDADGQPVYENPGYPFFVPGKAGHRAPHPPLDFAWKETPEGQPLLFAKDDEAPFRKAGERQYLDGGLPRHLVLGGEVLREFHSRWDFTKDFSIYDEEGNFVDGNLVAMELPEQGTAAEQAAMAAHATRSHSSYQPDGRPGNFILNGLPPAPGAPYAAPEVDDNGNSTFNSRRYKAAVIQQDVVFNKEGWHYPQQRFITLLDDVKDTVAGERPPEPFFFRANTGETVEFWHTNLVPKYYELDDFQVRTPTDILGQHIHLVKFDVTSSDGAGNGFNYEDGTFSPDEVRDRINSINAVGGLYHFDPRSQYQGKRQSKLRITPYREDYGNRLGKPPAGQDWNGAQTTIQRFDTDPLLNHLGEDRTLRTVFTHDHFGPSTHQQVGLYGAMLVEPAGSTWKNAITGCPMPDFGTCVDRDDGGPTSWQAVIEGYHSLESYREFAFATADLQLAYQRDSISQRQKLTGNWFTTPNQNYQQSLDEGSVPAGLTAAFAAQGALLGDNVKVDIIDSGSQWTITRNDVDVFGVTLDGANMAITNQTMEASWSDNDNAIWPPTAAITSAGDAPYPQLISDPGGGGNIGGWLVNYRNEPLDQRLQGDNNGGMATDEAYAYSSIPRNHPRLDKQPPLGGPIGDDPDGFRYPSLPLVPEGQNAVQPTDPYTPLLRTYAGDKVEMRVVVGAVDSPHSFRTQGHRWHPEPSFTDSGFRNTQGMGISEHFEAIFTVPPPYDSEQNSVDYLYAPSTSTQGQTKGAWGIMRAYNEEVADLVPLPNNPPGRSVPDFYDLPEGASVREFEVSLSLAADGQSLQYLATGQQAGDPLVLRANAGDWIRVILHNELSESDVAKLGTNWGANNANKSGSASGNTVQPYTTSATGGLHAMLLSYDSLRSAGLNIGLNGRPDGGSSGFQTVAPGASGDYLWYAGEISVDDDGQRRLTPVEFGSVNLLPAGPLLQASYNLVGALVIEPEGSQWSASDDHSLSATINDADGNLLFTEIVVLNQTAGSATVMAGSEVRLRVLNPGDNPGGAGAASDNVNLITVEGHGWQEIPYIENSTRIGDNPWSQTLGTQFVTPTESYNLVFPSAGGVDRVPGNYDFYYYPVGPTAKLGTITVVDPKQRASR